MNKSKFFFLLVPFLFLAAPGIAQKTGTTSGKGKKSEKVKTYKIHEHVMVTMKDGSQVEAVVHGHVYSGNRIAKNKYWVREWHSGHQGRVHARYLRHLSESEIASLHAEKNAKK